MDYPKTILLATDFGPASGHAAEAVIHLARAFDARAAILHVLEPMPTWTVALHYFEDLAQKRLREPSEPLGSEKVSIADVSLAKGSRAGEIFNEARALGADLIVIGAGKRSPFDRFSPDPVAETGQSRLPVVENGALVGLLCRRDVMDYMEIRAGLASPRLEAAS